MNKKSFYGPKPDECPESHVHCNECRTYPCQLATGPALEGYSYPPPVAVRARAHGGLDTWWRILKGPSLPHSPASDSRPELQRGDERTVDERLEGEV